MKREIENLVHKGQSGSLLSGVNLLYVGFHLHIDYWGRPIIIERKQKQGRWIFLLILGLYIFVHSVLLFRIKIAPWEAFAQWFASLPLT